MIGKVSGRLDYIAEDHALIEAAGVGYVIYASPRTLAALPEPGEPCALYTELVVREDLMQLFGFPTLAEKEWHRLLTSVQGVGPRSALAIVGLLGPEGAGRAIVTGDTAAVRKAPGVGPKLAQRIVLELRDADAPDAPAPKRRARKAPEAPDAGAASAAAQADALSALVNLGYPEGQAAAAVAEAAAEGDAPPTSAALIRAALRALAPK